MIAKCIYMKISLTPHKHILVSPRPAFRYKLRSFLTRIVRGVAPQFFTADSPHYVATSLNALEALLYSIYHFFLCTVRLDHLLNRYVRSVKERTRGLLLPDWCW